MSANTKVVEAVIGVDACGDPDEPTWDLYPIVPARETLHLHGEGLPKVGTIIAPGMIIIGMIGKSNTYVVDSVPNALEMNIYGREYVNQKYGHMWVNKSVYADENTSGKVTGSRVETRNGALVVVVELEQ